MKHIIGVGDMGISNQGGDLMVTHALGSCLGISAYDPVAQVGGLLHAMLPSSSINPEKAKANPAMFVDTGLPVLLEHLEAVGAHKNRLVVKVAGGASTRAGKTDRFNIGKRNYLTLKKIIWQHNLLLSGEDVGGEAPRTMYLDINSGRVWLTSGGQKKEF